MNQAVLGRLEAVPIFLITDRQGIPLAIDIPEEKGIKQVIFLFISPKDAEKLLEQIKTRGSVAEAKVFVTSLAEAYRMVQENKEQGVQLDFVPSESSIAEARKILRDQPIPVVPMFYAISRYEDKEGIITVETGGRQRIPFFFERTDLDKLLASIRQHKPEIARSAKVEVISLFTVLETMLEFNADKFELVPTRSTYEYLNSLPSLPSLPRK